MDSVIDACAKPSRRCFRFSLRAMLLMMVVIGGALGVFREARKQQVAVAALEEMGCSVDYDAPKHRPLRFLERVRQWLGDAEPNDVVAVYSGRDSKLNDAALVHLQAFRNLELLLIRRADLTDAGLAHLAGLQKLAVLIVHGTRITGSGFVHFDGMDQLVYIHFMGAPVSDAGLAHLGKLPKLSTLSLEGAMVTNAGAAELKKALPNLHISMSPCVVHRTAPLCGM